MARIRNISSYLPFEMQLRYGPPSWKGLVQSQDVENMLERQQRQFLHVGNKTFNGQDLTHILYKVVILTVSGADEQKMWASGRKAYRSLLGISRKEKTKEWVMASERNRDLQTEIRGICRDGEEKEV